MTDWQPIATAPKDGTVVLLHVDWEPLTFVGFYGAGPSTGEDEPTWRVKWDGADISGGYDAPTHWMPLPKAPTP